MTHVSGNERWRHRPKVVRPHQSGIFHCVVAGVQSILQFVFCLFELVKSPKQLVVATKWVGLDRMLVSDCQYGQNKLDPISPRDFDGKDSEDLLSRTKIDVQARD